MVGTKFVELRQKPKNMDVRQHVGFWQSKGAIWIDSVSIQVVRPGLFYFGLEGPIGVRSWIRKIHRYASLAWKRWVGS